ncbi:MAG TPA: zf-HC2 domain-containing protein [Candidatus Angelobacter sp.]|nr:zf-HC2 domain-containing protein [Candidatus Angelobacter sp.]
MARLREFAMKCEEIEELLPDYMRGKLNSDQAVLVQEHVAECARCDEEVTIWKKLLLLPDEQPGPSVRARFDAMLESYQQGRWEKASLASERKRFLGLADLVRWMRTPSLSAAWASVLLVAGFLGGRYIDRDQSEKTELAELRHELQKTSQLVALSYLQQQSASGRLQGVSYSTRIQEPDPQVLDALVHTLRYDSNVDVRLAALDALGRYGKRPEVSRGLVESLEGQQSPLVQVALIDVLVDLHESSALGPLRRLQQTPNVDPNVRKHAAWGIQKLS